MPRRLRADASAIARATGRPEAAFQAMAIFENLKTILKEAGVSVSALAKIVLYLKDFRDFIAFDTVCSHYLQGPKPSFSCVTIPSASPVPGARMCIEAIAVKE